tara:strand:- start:3922 stop:4977 length:1056 start_codon:yes stop_codon:yes gene_type:complete
MNIKIDTTKPVLVTGASGFVGGWVVKRLIEKGVTVHAPIRDRDNKEKIKPLSDISDKGPGNIVFFEANLLDPNSYDEAMNNCEIVFHIASPFLYNFNDAYKDFIEPAVQGTQNVLDSVNRTQTVKKVILTSSCTAIFGDHVDINSVPDKILTEDIWNETSNEKHQPYSYSKVLAEKLAWEMEKKQNHWKLAVINPALVIGPSISGKSTSASHDFIKQLGDGKSKAGCPKFEIGMVDVRDVAEAHINAAYINSAEGRHIIFNEVTSFLDLANMLQEKYHSYPLPKKELPKLLVWLIVPLIEKSMTRKMISRCMGHKWNANNQKSISKLEVKYTSIKKSIEEMFQQMIEQGQI